VDSLPFHKENFDRRRTDLIYLDDHEIAVLHAGRDPVEFMDLLILRIVIQDISQEQNVLPALDPLRNICLL
jgi:hypothetical protein